MRDFIFGGVLYSHTAAPFRAFIISAEPLECHQARLPAAILTADVQTRRSVTAEIIERS